METIADQRAQRRLILDSTELNHDGIGANLERSFCANSDLFTHNLLGAPRDLPDTAYQERADFFHSGEFI